jgi:hypothetical protein
MPLLTNDVWRAMPGVSIERAVKGHGFRLIVFVFMPEQVYLFVLPMGPAGGPVGRLEYPEGNRENWITRLLVDNSSSQLEL